MQPPLPRRTMGKGSGREGHLLLLGDVPSQSRPGAGHRPLGAAGGHCCPFDLEAVDQQTTAMGVLWASLQLSFSSSVSASMHRLYPLPPSLTMVATAVMV